MDINTESRSPKVGVFWFVEGQLIHFSEGVKNPGGVIDTEYDHHHHWGKVIERFPKLGTLEYFEVPRGRVLYAQGFRILTSRDLVDDNTKMRKVMRAYCLPIKQTTLIADAHYEIDNIDWDPD